MIINIINQYTMDITIEPSNKRQFFNIFDMNESYQKIQNYERRSTIMSFIDELDNRITAIKSIIEDLKIDSNKNMWRKDLAELEELKSIYLYYYPN
jgi:hypothetical protein